MSSFTCPVPFIEASSFGTEHGYVAGRLCASMPGGSVCCLPCPLTDWVYPDNFKELVTGVEWLAVVSTICCAYLLLSWLCLPVEKTNRHYLSVCFAIGVLLMNLSFVVTLAARPEQCYDAITANDMKTNKACGASGSLLIFGGWCSVLWCFMRSLSLHLQICWQKALGPRFIIAALIAGWGIPIMGITLALVFSGVSFRFGATCHINHKNSLADLWVPLLLFSVVTLILTLSTFGYCVHVYLQTLGGPQLPSTANGSSLPTVAVSSRSLSPQQAWRRIRRVIRIQWRGIACVIIMVSDVIFFAIVLVFQDQTLQDVLTNPSKADKWVACLVLGGGDKTKCWKEEGGMVVSEATIAAVLVLLTLNGVWLLLLLGRRAMIKGWVDLARDLGILPKSTTEFVSADAHLAPKGQQQLRDRSSYEMLSRQSTAGSQAPGSVPVLPALQGISGRKTPQNVDVSRSPEPTTPSRTKVYSPPPRSFSSPRPPVRSLTKE